MTDILSKQLSRYLQDWGTRQRFPVGGILQFQNETVEKIFFIESGQALAVAFDKSGRESWLNTFESCQFTGIENLMIPGLSDFQIIAKTDLTVLTFKRTHLLELMNSDPRLNNFVLESLVAQIRRFQEVRLETLRLTKRGRIASEFKRLARPVEKKPDTHIIWPAPILAEMALHLGIARETISRTVNDLVRNEVLERNRGAFIIPDLSLLEAQVL